MLLPVLSFWCKMRLWRKILLSFILYAFFATTTSTYCKTYGEFQGSEDSTLWRAGIAFQSSGLERPTPRFNRTTQKGMILSVNISTNEDPSIASIPIYGIPKNFDFRPHGLHFDNSSNVLYAVNHGHMYKEESIVVFDVETTSSNTISHLQFKYALTSPNFRYYNVSHIYFLNDVAAVDGRKELYTTQFGPQPSKSGEHQVQNKYLWHCAWNETMVNDNGRLNANCTIAYSQPSLGLNGIAINPQGTHLWVNDLYRSRLWLFDRREDGVLKLEGVTALPGMIDNVERDYDSGDLTMGMFYNPDGGTGGAIVQKCKNRTLNKYSDPFIAITQDSSNKQYQVSTSLVYQHWTILGSPWDTSLVICKAEVASSHMKIYVI